LFTGYVEGTLGPLRKSQLARCFSVDGSNLTSADTSFADFIQEAIRILEAGEKKGMILRLMGASAIKLHCPRYNYLYESMKRPISDLDFMTYGKFNSQMKRFFIELGYTPNDRIIAFYGKQRHIYYDEKKEIMSDVFFDKLDMCHTIDFKGRLELDYPTITLADMLLEKMQIVKINEKDIKDTIIMLREHDIGDSEKEMINAKYISKLLSDDWGFYYTTTTNLNKIKSFLTEFSVLTEEDRKDVATKIDKLLVTIESEPKSFKWKMRAKVGISKKWYNEVEEIVR